MSLFCSHDMFIATYTQSISYRQLGVMTTLLTLAKMIDRLAKVRDTTHILYCWSHIAIVIGYSSLNYYMY